MDIRKLKYEKGEGVRKESIPALAPKTSFENRVLNEDKTVISSPNYTKEEGVLSPRLFFVLSGGTVRERDFLQELEKKRSFKSLRVLFLSTDKFKGGLTPNMIWRIWENINSKRLVEIEGYEYQLTEIDVVYLFTDVDHYEDELRELLVNHKNYGEHWIISNPDFEIWLYYCFRNQPDDDLAELLELSQSEQSSKLKTINGRFNNGGGLDPRKAFEHLHEGVAHSKECYKEDEMHFPMLLSTQMHFFAEDVLVRLDKEYESWKNKKQELANSYREKLRNSIL